MSVAASSFAKEVEAVRSAPWKPHLGIALNLRASGQTLRTRELSLPPKLPQLPRPSCEPAPGSKSSQARSAAAVKCQ
eukprot:5939498-Pyramimonas_sp.AAC.1